MYQNSKIFLISLIIGLTVVNYLMPSLHIKQAIIFNPHVALLPPPPSGPTKIIYREVFPFFADSANAGARALKQGWEGYRNGAVANALQIFKVAPSPAPIHKNAYASYPTGQLDSSIAFWSPTGVSGVSMFTKEISLLNISTDSVTKINWQTNNSNQGSGTRYVPTAGDSTRGIARALIRVNGIYYASKDSVQLRNSFPDSMSYNNYSINLNTTLWGRLCLGGTDCSNGDPVNAKGPRKTALFIPNLIKPAGVLQEIGIFIDFFTGKYRMANFEMEGYYSATKLFVDSSVIVSGGGSSWSNAIKNLQDALLIARETFIDTICVAKGTYYPDTIGGNVINRDLSFNIPDLTVMLGGFPSGGGTLNDRDWVCNKTILSGDIDKNKILDNGNSYHVVTTANVSEATVVDGFYITDGNAVVTSTPNAQGGGWRNDGSGTGNKSNPRIFNCVFSNNYGIEGGGLANIGNAGNSSPILTNVILHSNMASDGGAMYNNGTSGGNSSPLLTNVIISGNKANNGGGMSNNGNQGNSSPIITNVVINGNKAVNGGAMDNIGTGGKCKPVITNSILWNNESTTNGPVFYNVNAAPSVSYSFIQNKNIINDPLVTFGGGSIDAGNNFFQDNGSDPMFFNPQVASAAPTTAGDFHVLSSSQAIDMGLNDSVHVMTDLDGDPRIKFSRVDIGAYENGNVIDCNLYSGLTTVYVDSAATGANNGTSWANAFTDFQDGLAVVKEGCVDTVKVAEGTYYPSDTVFIRDCHGVPIDTLFPNKGVSFDIPDSAVVLGGYGHGSNNLTQDLFCHKTILCGDIDRDGTLSGNTYHVVSTTRVSEYTILDGFWITGGNAVSPVVDFTQLSGGGVYNNGIGGRCIPVLRNLIISGNNALSGGGMTNDGLAGLSSPTIINCIISGNTCIGGGAGMENQGRFGVSNPVITNCIISGNSSDNTGGGMYNNTGPGICKPVITNSVFWNNYAKTSDSIIAQNDPYRENGNIDTNFTIITHSIIQPGHLPIYVDITDLSNKRSDPLFLSAPLYSAAPTNSGDFHVIAGSPAIDMGDNAAPNLYSIDLDGKPRIINSTVDIGAFEFGEGMDCSTYAGIHVLYVDSSATGSNNGTSWMNAFNDLQNALAIVRSCGVDTVKVAQGTYYPSDTLIAYDKCTGEPTITILPARQVSFNIPDSMILIGGYGHGADTLIRNWKCNKTILSGEIQQDGDSTNNSYHVVITSYVTSATVIDGFCITDGNANGLLNFANGGGWFNDGSGKDKSSNPTLLNCSLSGNSSANYGGGLYNNGRSLGKSNPTLTNCILSENNAYRGGGIYNDAINGMSSPLMLNCIISGNAASNFGGGMATDAQSSGNSQPKLVNCVFNGNIAIYGGAVWNDATCGNAHPDFTNCIFWNNTASNGPVFYNDNSSPLISYCLIQGTSLDDPTVTYGNNNTNGGNNKFQMDGFDPQFFYAPAGGLSLEGDFHLKYTSSAIDMGLNSVNLTPADLDGNTRIQNGTIDIGAYEFQGTDCSLYASKVLYVDSFAVAGLNNGTSWSNAFTHLQDALEAAYSCDIDTIKVARGTYYPSYPDTVYACNVSSIIPVSRSDFFAIPDGIVLLGGFNGICVPDPDVRNTKCNITILSGDIDHDATFAGNSYNVVKTIGYKDTITCDGFVIEWGDATPVFEEGGGWWDGTTADSAKLNIRNTIFRNNKAVFGGGFYGEGPRELMVNQAEFYDNAANCNGGGAYVNPFTFTAGDTAFIRFENVLWHHNNACEGGGLAGVVAAFPPDVIDIVNNTFSLNSPDAYNSSSKSIVRILNTIMWNDVVSEITGSNLPVVNNSLIQGGFTGNNNKNADPLFRNPASDFRLLPSSPAVNMGDNNYVQDSIDLNGLPRISFMTVDIGAYESGLNCDSLMLFIGSDGSGPFVPIDSLFGIKGNPEFSFYINGVINNAGISFNCLDTGINYVELLITKPGCLETDTLDHCIKVITVLDTFPKLLTGLSDLNVSLDANCIFVLTPYNVLSNFKGCSNDFDVHLQYPFGTNHNVPDDKLDRSHLGYCMTYSVTQKSTGNTTWGKLCVEDKYPPRVGDAVEYKTCFDFGRLPTGTYKVADNCSDSAVVTIVGESFTDYGCDSPRYQGVVTRHLIVKDQWGNTNDFTKKIYILKVSLDSVVCPVNKSYECGTVLAKDAKGNPDPSVTGAPTVIVNGISSSLWPNSASCKLTVLYRDEKVDICGPGGFKILRTWIITDWCTIKEKECKQWIEVVDKQAPVVKEDQEMNPPFYSTDPHDCGAYVNIDTLKIVDCSKVKQNYSIEYQEEGQTRIIQGVLPVKHIWLPMGEHIVKVLLVDECKNTSKASFTIPVVDFSPPTPVCDEYTQVTVDPEHCWAVVAAKDLDNGSHDNCCGILHFAAAKMDSIIYWQGYWNTRLETEVGKENYWRYKSYYEAYIEEWINIYVFSDTVHFDECGTNQVVLRVYEACGVPRYDPHVWPCSNHTWFCYNTFNTARSDMNYNWFDPKGARSCNFRPSLTSIELYVKRIDDYSDKGYFDPKFAGATQSQPCQLPFYFPAESSKSDNPPGNYCSGRYYNDCMVNVLVDDKQAPVVDHLEDVTVYCDGAPEWADYPKCDDMYPSYPGELRDSKGVIHGYYGGSSQFDVHMGTGDHNDLQACDQNKGWAPIYCKNWLYLDSFDRGGKVNLSDYFEKPVLVDKKRPLDHKLKASEFTFTDNCRLDDASLSVTNNGTINGCGEGWISRTWTIKDKCGNAVSATQKIIVKHRSDFEVIFPADKKVTCDFLNRADTSALGAGKPKLSDDDCEQLGVTYKDEIFTIVDSACYKIVRTWTIIDWCIYNAGQQKRYPDVIVNDSLRANTTDRACVYRSLKDNNDGYMQYVQIIKVVDEIKPIVSCSDQTVCISDGCSATLNIPLVGTDNCADQVIFRVDITKPDGSHDRRQDITAITGSNFTAGAYKIQIIGKDRCGNEDTCNMTLTIKDCKKPTPYCLNGIATVVMPSTGSVQVWAKDFDLGASDNCTEASKLKFSFTKNTADAGKVLTCANIPNGLEQPINVEVWVTDEAGNQDFCNTYILLQDNGDATNPGGACKDTAALVANITGKLFTEEKEGVEFANVDVKGMQGIPSIKTATDGSYVFSSIPMPVHGGDQHVSIKALRDDNPMNGVSTLDLVLIQKHIMGTESLKSPYKMIAADVDNSNDITAIDLLELRKLILGIYDKLPSNTSWKFIPKSYTFSDASNPWKYPAEDVLTDMTEKMVRDFVGVKIGDVNSTAAAHSLVGTEIRSSETGLIFEVQDQVFKAGDKVTIEFRSPNFKGVSGFQGTMSIGNKQLAMDNSQLAMGNGQLAMGFNNFGRRWEHEGLITMSWNTNTSIDIKDDAVLFTMHFKAQTAGRLSEVLRIGSQHTIAESYEGKGELGNLSIRFIGQDGKEVAGKSELYQNYPNPFDQRTVIGLNLAESVKGNLKITDVTGRTLKTISKEWNKGYNEIWLNRSELQAGGILFYTFESKDFTATKRMILLQ